MDNYEPRVIIPEEHKTEYLISLHRTLGYTAENLDPPSPFRGLLEEGDNLKIVLNDTNDLRHCIKEFEDKILEGELKHVIIGDPHTFGYGVQILDKMLEDVSIPAFWEKDKQWILVKLNIVAENKLIIEESRIRIK